MTNQTGKWNEDQPDQNKLESQKLRLLSTQLPTTKTLMWK